MKVTSRIALDWAIRAFGRQRVFDFPTRALRVTEEAIELAQAHSVSKEKILELVETVYSKPPGDIEQELGGVAMTAEVLAAAHGHDLEAFFETELRRVLAKPTEFFSQRDAAKQVG